MSEQQEYLQICSALIDNYNRYGEGLDSKNWPLVRACFADEVYIDYGPISAESGDPSIPRKSDDWVAHLQGAINGFDITQHMITNHRVSIGEDGVSCRAYLSAGHIIFPDPAITIAREQDLVTVVGEYTNFYEQVQGQWKICRSALKVNWSTGNLALFEAAALRAAAR